MGQSDNYDLPLDVAGQIDELCDDFEDRFRRDERPVIEEYLTRVSPAYSANLLEFLICIEVECLSSSPARPTLERLRERFPNQTHIVERAYLNVAKHPDKTQIPRRDETDNIAAQSTLHQSVRSFEVPHERLFGDYELLECIAQGGMGVVYKARQLSLNRIVAVKMILTGSQASDSEIRRFQVEAKAAATLQHPNIVAIHEIGESRGRPFFSMEFIDGVSLASLIRDSPTPLKNAVPYIKQISQAIQYAHEQGIIHRDLKPSNVIIDKANQPRITDFGLARRIEGDTQLTKTGELMGTPSYMSPEQARGDRSQVAASSDVYSLGCILYELLTGFPPFRAESSLDILIKVLEEDPISPCLINSAISRDLDTICLKCLEKEPWQRYGSAEELADELDRVMNDEPIRARPISSLSRSWRWCKKRPVVSVLAMSSIALLLAVTVVSVIGYSKTSAALAEASTERLAARRAQANAEREAEAAIQVSKFLIGLFEDIDPLARAGRSFGVQKRKQVDVTAKEIVARSTEKLSDSFKDRPLIRAVLLDKIGNVHLSLGQADEAEPLLSEALAIRRHEFGNKHPDIATSLQSLGLLHSIRQSKTQSIQCFREALAMRRDLLRYDDPLVSETMFNLGVQLTIAWLMDEAEPILLEALENRRRVLGNESREVALNLFALGELYLLKKQPSKALPLIEEAVGIFETIEGDYDFSAIAKIFLEAQLAGQFGNRAEADRLYGECLSLSTEMFGEEHFIVAWGEKTYADYLTRQRDFKKAEKMHQEVLTKYRKLYGEASHLVARQYIQLARCRRDLGAYGEAESHIRRALQILRGKSDGSYSPLHLAESLHILGVIELRKTDYDIAATHLHEAVAIRRRIQGPTHKQLDMVIKHLEAALIRRNDPARDIDALFSDPAKSDGQDFYDLALLRTIASVALCESKSSLSDDEEADRDRIADRAIEALAQAVKEGFVDSHNLRTAPDFESLRTRPAFSELIGEADPDT